MEMLQANDMREASRLANELLASKGLTLDKGSSAYEELCRAIARAMVDP